MAKVMRNYGFVTFLRTWGLRVEQEPGWRTRGRPYNFYPRAIVPHHDASGANSGNFGSLRVVRDGRPGLSGPLSQFVLGRDGTVKIVAAGYANHAGYGGPKPGVPANMANTYAIGIEAANNGVGEPWPKAQLNAYYRLCAALMVWLGIKDINRVFAHKEWTSRKIDPAGINMNEFRRNVQKALAAGPSVKTVSLSKLKPRKHNKDVIELKKALRKRGFFKAKNTSDYFGRGLRDAYKAYQRSLGYRGRDADGVPGRTSLQKLGFRVVS